MAGIYVHIPFCKQACYYCNFHFSTSLQYKSDVIDAIVEEIRLQKNYLQGENIETIYFGGGTPSILNHAELEAILKAIYKHHNVSAEAEITLEANPDDLNDEKLKQLSDSPINRLSIGIQSFFDEDLRFMNRAHSAKEAIQSIGKAKKYGFNNLTIDLIYGTPTLNNQQWISNIQTALEFEIPHLSCYCLTIEPQTALYHFVQKGKAPPVNDEIAAAQFEILINKCIENNYDHYEISNFAYPDYYSKHNTSYWLGKKYLGIGPGAHSYDGISRQWNVANNIKYLKAINQRIPSFEREILSPKDQYNEYVLTSLRTIWGTDLNKIASNYQSHFLKEIIPFLNQNQVSREADIFRLTKKGKLLADKITMELFL